MSTGEAKMYVYTHVRLLELNIIDGIFHDPFILFFFLAEVESNVA